MRQKIILLLNTIRHLKPIQFYWRLYLRFSNKCPSFDDIDKPSSRRLNLVNTNERIQSFYGDSFKFLNHRSPVDVEQIRWNDPKQAKLWLYNLHYADYLMQTDLENSAGIDLMQRWIAGNPACEGNGWEPYPLSLRIVNWVKFLSIASIDPDEKHSLEVSLFGQCRSLRKQLEFHILGNHLFKNAVALLYAGYFFSSPESDEWFKKAREILLAQLEEQVLADGGHFERSPMYHALILEDILDCLNVVRSSDQLVDSELESLLADKARVMLSFLEEILHPDGTLPVFNDTAQGISSTAEQLFEYAKRLKLDWIGSNSTDELQAKSDFGLFILKKGAWHLAIDGGKIGPDYLPGHAHCDTLSYELALAGRLIAVNAGVFQYAGDERNLYRSTKSHNTVSVDDNEQHEIWSTFRVARRGYPKNISAKTEIDNILFSGQHTGFLRFSQGAIHQRDVDMTEDCISVIDHVIGKGEHDAKSYIHLHPGVEIVSKTEMAMQLKIDQCFFTLEINQADSWTVEDYNFSPEFGIKIPAKKVMLFTKGSDRFSSSYSFKNH